jgi:hypothetical protein
MSVASDETRARRAAKRVGLSVRKQTLPSSPYGPAAVVYRLIDPFNGVVVHDNILSTPTDVVEFCRNFSPPRH